MKTDTLGIPIYSYQDVLELLYTGNLETLSAIVVDPTDKNFEEFNKSADQFGTDKLIPYAPINLTQEIFDRDLQSVWFMPEEYQKMDIEAWVREQTPPWDPESTRVEEELAAFRERNMTDLLCWMKYFVDTCRANNVVWGVGRGSSVASYVLYLIGVHKINSLKYNLDWREFLR